MTKGNRKQKVKEAKVRCGICGEMTLYKTAVYDNLLRTWTHFSCLEKEHQKLTNNLKNPPQ